MTNTGTPRNYGGGSLGPNLKTLEDLEKPPSFFKKQRYRFDNTLAKGAKAMITWLLVAAAISSIPFTIALRLLPTKTHDNILSNEAGSKGFLRILDDYWQSFYAVLGKGGFKTNTWDARAFTILVTVFSLVIASTLFAFITATVNKRIADLKKGKGPVYESGHTTILGWGPQVFPILQQLEVANANKPSTALIISLVARETMDDEIKLRVGELKNTKIITRNGDPSSPRVLAQSSINNSRSVIVLGNKGPSAATTAVLSVLANIGMTGKVSIVADVNDAATAEALYKSTGGNVLAVRSEELIARVTAHAIRQPGLAAVYLDMLDFEGDEIYFANVPAVIGKTFGEVITGLGESSAIGIRHSDGSVNITPPVETIIADGDQIIAIAKDDDKILWAGDSSDLSGIKALTQVGDRSNANPDKILIIGWSPMAKQVVLELGNFGVPGSTALVFAQTSKVTADELKGLETTNLTVTAKGTTGDIDELIEVINSQEFNHIVIFGYRGKTITPAESDALTLLTMLEVNHVKNLPGSLVANARVIAEIQDSNNVELARVVVVDDLVVSDRLGSLMMSQLSESPGLYHVFEELFGPEGTFLSSKPVQSYVPLDVETTFATLVAAGRSRGEVVIGYRQPDASDPTNPTVGIHVNPAKSTVLTPTDGTYAIVIGPLE
ncbi:MAG: hypothetical protein NT174_00765 [Actinobacteria bacterium]|nr:hypothetical protein [Actinomycetota bacterium]